MAYRKNLPSSLSAIRRRRDQRACLFIMASIAAALFAMLYGANAIDKAHGVGAGQSLASWGL